MTTPGASASYPRTARQARRLDSSTAKQGIQASKRRQGPFEFWCLSPTRLVTSDPPPQCRPPWSWVDLDEPGWSWASCKDPACILHVSCGRGPGSGSLTSPCRFPYAPLLFPFPQKFEQEGQGKYLILLTPAYSCSQGAIKGDQDFLAGPAVLDSPDG